MNKKISLGAAIAFMAIIAAATFSITWIVTMLRFNDTVYSLKEAPAPLLEALGQLEMDLPGYACLDELDDPSPELTMVYAAGEEPAGVFLVDRKKEGLHIAGKEGGAPHRGDVYSGALPGRRRRRGDDRPGHPGGPGPVSAGHPGVDLNTERPVLRHVQQAAASGRGRNQGDGTAFRPAWSL